MKLPDGKKQQGPPAEAWRTATYPRVDCEGAVGSRRFWAGACPVRLAPSMGRPVVKSTLQG